jgi:acyl-CoA hydrolase
MGVAVNERVRRLISIAHPDFRDGVYEAAQEMRLV